MLWSSSEMSANKSAIVILKKKKKSISTILRTLEEMTKKVVLCCYRTWNRNDAMIVIFSIVCVQAMISLFS